MKPGLPIRATFFVILLPVTVAGYVPFRILRASGDARLPRLGFSSALAFGTILLGAAVALSCVWTFFSEGRGTLAPVDPPRRLVVGGPYRFTRNPMYNGVLAVLLGEAWMFRSAPVLWYAAAFFAAAHLFVVFYEERRLASRFGESFRAYRAAVPRWGFRLRAPKTGAAP